MSHRFSLSRQMPATGVALAIAMLLVSSDSTGQSSTGRLFFLDIRLGRVVSGASDGSDLRVLASGRSGIPDGIAVDVEQRQVFWSIMDGRATTMG
jgi:sugar lactone lactonase YvrE